MFVSHRRKAKALTDWRPSNRLAAVYYSLARPGFSRVPAWWQGLALFQVSVVLFENDAALLV
jgi:hypothetical protein